MSTSPGESLTLEQVQQLADELRSAYEDLVNGETVAAPAQIRVLVAEWATNVLPAIDERISRCYDLIRRGLRNEAIDYALEPPSLFQAVPLLNLERFGRTNYSAWMDASRAAGLLLPNTPQLEKFAEIEAARDRLDLMRPLLEQWRRMNIQRAPLSRRIRMLRDLDAQDTGTHIQVWHALLRTHEAHRIMEIKAGLARAREQLATDRTLDITPIEHDLKRVLADLRKDWSTLRPPPDIFDHATNLLAKARQLRVDAVIDALVPELEAAYAGLTSDRPAAKTKLRGLLDAWNQALVDRGVADPSDPRLSRVRAVLEYGESLREIDRLTREVDQRATERPATLGARLSWADDLDRMMDRIDDVASRLPTEDVDPRLIRALSDRVGDVSDRVHSEARTRKFLSVAGVAAVVIGVAATAWAVYASSQHLASVKAAVAEADVLVKQVDAGKDPGSEPGDAFSETVRRDPRVAAAFERVAQARRKRDDRTKDFAKHLGDIASALDELQAAKRPDPLAPWPEAFARATTLLATAREQLAAGDDQRAQLERPAAMLRTKAREFTEAADDAFEDQVQRLEADLAAIGPTLVDDLGQADRQLEHTETTLEKLRVVSTAAACPTAVDGYEGRKIVSQPVAALVSTESKAVAALNDLRTRRETMAGIAGRENQADRLLAEGKYPEYADFIRKIADDLGAGPVARDYASAARDHELWRELADWQRFVASLGEPKRTDAKQAAVALETMRKLNVASMRSQDAKQTKQWMEPVLEQLANSATERIEELRAKFIAKLDGQHGEMLDGVIWKKADQPTQQNYPRYYCLLRDRPLPGQEKTIKYVNGRPDKSRLWPTAVLRFDPEFHDVADSPQKSLALACKKVVESAPRTGFAIDRLGTAVVLECSRRWKPPAGEIDIDPCLQAILLRFLLADACDASPFLRQHFTKSLKVMDAGTMPDGLPRVLVGVDNEVFSSVLDPAKQDDGAWVHANRAKCAAFVQLAANEAAEATRALDARERVFAEKCEALRQYRCVGRLRRLAAGGWAISGGDPVTREGKQLFVAGGPQHDYKMVPCLTCDKDGNVPPGTDVKARAGEPVFVVMVSGKAG